MPPSREVSPTNFVNTGTMGSAGRSTLYIGHTTLALTLPVILVQPSVTRNPTVHFPSFVGAIAAVN